MKLCHLGGSVFPQKHRSFNENRRAGQTHPLSCWIELSKRPSKQYYSVITISTGYLLEIESKNVLTKIAHALDTAWRKEGANY